MDQRDKAERFAALHRAGDPLILFNAWDAGSAKSIAEAGARAIATGSWSVAAAQGYGDREDFPLELAIANTARISGAVDVPVTIDFEGGYASEPKDVAENVTKLIAAGAIGCNFEDQRLGGDGLYEVAEQSERITAIRRAGDNAGFRFFVNARTDLFLKSKPDEHHNLVEPALARGRAYADAGADGLFVPGLGDDALIERVCAESPLPVNIMVWPGHTPPLRRLAELGVARISHAGGPWRVAMKALAEAATAAHRLEG